MIKLSEEEIHARLLIGSLRLTNCVSQVWDCLGILFLTNLTVSKDGISDGDETLRYAVASSSGEQVLRIVIPFKLGIALGFENPCLCYDIGLAEIQPLDICER